MTPDWLREQVPEGERDAVARKEMPTRVSPMLATLTDERFDDPDWIYERKWDGVRLVVFRNRDGEARVVTRNEKDRSDTYPEIVEGVAALGGPAFVADGEVVAFTETDGERVSSFSRLQHRMQVTDPDEARQRAGDVPAHLYLFDLLWLDGHDVTALPLDTRKRLLRLVLDFEDPVHYTTHRREDGTACWREACENGWEGVIAKDATSPYVHSRSTNWLKFKCVTEQEFVVGGFTEPEGGRVGFGALLLGTSDGDDLVYRGKVGTGWDDDELERLRRRMDALERRTSPFSSAGGDDDDTVPSGDEVHWITPKLVAEVGFTEWTDAGRLRHPRFLGLRGDKDPGDVVRERPA